jgi:hypothetical protein
MRPVARASTRECALQSLTAESHNDRHPRPPMRVEDVRCCCAARALSKTKQMKLFIPLQREHAVDELCMTTSAIAAATQQRAQCRRRLVEREHEQTQHVARRKINLPTTHVTTTIAKGTLACVSSSAASSSRPSASSVSLPSPLAAGVRSSRTASSTAPAVDAALRARDRICARARHSARSAISHAHAPTRLAIAGVRAPKAIVPPLPPRRATAHMPRHRYTRHARQRIHSVSRATQFTHARCTNRVTAGSARESSSRFVVVVVVVVVDRVPTSASSDCSTSRSRRAHSTSRGNSGASCVTVSSLSSSLRAIAAAGALLLLNMAATSTSAGASRRSVCMAARTARSALCSGVSASDGDARTSTALVLASVASCVPNTSARRTGGQNIAQCSTTSHIVASVFDGRHRQRNPQTHVPLVVAADRNTHAATRRAGDTTNVGTKRAALNTISATTHKHTHTRTHARAIREGNEGMHIRCRTLCRSTLCSTLHSVIKPAHTRASQIPLTHDVNPHMHCLCSRGRRAASPSN